MSKMSELDIIRMKEERSALVDEILGFHEDVYDDESCTHCGSRNFERLDDEFECYNCGELFNERSQS